MVILGIHDGHNASASLLKNGKLIWFHGASVGELYSIMPVLEKLEKNKRVSNLTDDEVFATFFLLSNGLFHLL